MSAAAPRVIDLRPAHLRPQPAVLAPAPEPEPDPAGPRWRPGFHPVTMGILAGLLAAFTIAVIRPGLHQTAAPAPAPHPTVAAAAVTPTATPTPKPAISARPTDRIAIPALGVNAPIIQLGLVAGALDTPKTLWQVGHYRASAAPGSAGTAILVGHAGAPRQVGVFEHLNRLKAGDQLTYRYLDGRSYTFIVKTSAAYPVNSATAELLYRNTATPSLNLVSCYGHYDPATKEYDQRWIITADLIAS